MAHLIVQLSDIHFQTADDAVFSRVDEIARAIHAALPAAEGCVIVLSGDITYSGSVPQFSVAKVFCDTLRSKLERDGMPQVEFIAVPGNHDCSLDNEVDTRQYVLDSLEKFISKAIDRSGLTYEAVISVQSAFFAFEAALRESVIVPDANRLLYHRKCQLGARVIDFFCINTSWLSQRHDQQAKLFVPSEILIASEDSSDLNIAVFHHPYNWLQAENKSRFQSFVESTVDLSLTGHEHTAGGSRQLSLDGRQVDYLQAPALQEHGSEESGFQLVVLDFESTKQVVVRFAWKNSIYSEIQRIDWTLAKNPRKLSHAFINTEEFTSELTGMGVGLHHPRCSPPSCSLKLRDLYVYPNFRHRNLDYKLSDDSTANTTVVGPEIINFVRDRKKVVIFGADDSGKTALAKTLYMDLKSDDLTPLLISGDDLKSRSKPGQLDYLIKESIKKQYPLELSEAIGQLEKSKRLLIIDDFDKARLVRSVQEQVISHLASSFESIVVIASDLVQLEELARTNEASPLRAFEFCTIKEFGKYHRHKLINKWLFLGREESIEYETLEKEVGEKDKTISTLMGRNVLPHFPITILTLLQLLEARESSNTANGSYGYLYEVLIKSALSRMGHGPSDVDAKVTYLSGLGYALFSKHQAYLSEEQFREAHDKYCIEYDMNRDFPRMVSDFVHCDILTHNNGEYRFKYPYIFFYAVAKYLQEHAATLRVVLHQIADHIHNDTNANILIFYVYLTKDQELIQRIVSNSAEIYSECKPCDMDKDVAPFNAMYKIKPPPLELAWGTSAENRDKHHRNLDDQVENAESSQAGEEASDHDLKYDKELEDIVKIQIGFKTLQILGQVLRNFTGSLPGDLKLKITEECYSLGMRILKFIHTYSVEDLNDVRQYVGSLINERTGITDTAELATRTDSAILWLNSVAAFGCIKRVSYAVGHVDLAKTYSRLLGTTPALATRMIDATIKLDHFSRIPESELDDIASDTAKNKNLFSHSVMRDLVGDFLYLYHTDFPKMQKLGSQWDIKVTNPKLLTNQSKR